jgi:hypothetical protein
MSKLFIFDAFTDIYSFCKDHSQGFTDGYEPEHAVVWPSPDLSSPV